MCSDRAEFSFLRKKTAFWCSFKRVTNWRLVCPIYLLSQSLHGIEKRASVRCSFVTGSLKAHFQPWCNARRDPISCNTKFPDYWKPSKIVFFKSHPEHIVNCFTVNTLAVRHLTVSLQYFGFCPEESEENFFKCHASYSVNKVGEEDNVRIFSLSRGAWGF